MNGLFLDWCFVLVMLSCSVFGQDQKRVADKVNITIIVETLDQRAAAQSIKKDFDELQKHLQEKWTTVHNKKLSQLPENERGDLQKRMDDINQEIMRLNEWMENLPVAIKNHQFIVSAAETAKESVYKTDGGKTDTESVARLCKLALSGITISEPELRPALALMSQFLESLFESIEEIKKISTQIVKSIQNGSVDHSLMRSLRQSNATEGVVNLFEKVMRRGRPDQKELKNVKEQNLRDLGNLYPEIPSLLWAFKQYDFLSDIFAANPWLAKPGDEEKENAKHILKKARIFFPDKKDLIQEVSDHLEKTN